MPSVEQDGADHTAMSELFRKSALDKLTAPERLDERVSLIALRWWITLAALFAVLCVATLWGWFGRISTRVNGSGMLLELSGFRNVVSVSEGVIGYLNVQEGAFVEEGEVLGVVSLPMQQMELKFYQDKLDLLRTEVDEMNAASEQNSQVRAEFFEHMRSGNAESIEKLTRILEKLTELADTYKNYSGRGLVTQVESLRMLQDMLNASINVTRQQQENMRTDIEKEDYDLNFKREFWQKQQKLMDSEYELKSRMAQFMNRSLIISPTRGTIVNVQKSAGDNVTAGEVVFLMQPSFDDALYISAFIPAAKSKSVREGQLAYVSPANIEPQRAGYILGIVQRVEPYPATFEKLMNVFKNRDLTQMLKGDEVAVMVEICLIPDAENSTGFRWTGKAPEGVRISAGTICQVAIAIEQRPPITYVLPWMREKLLGDVKREVGSAGK